MSPLVGLGDMLTTTGIVFLAGSLLSFFFAAFATKSESARFGGVCGTQKAEMFLQNISVKNLNKQAFLTKREKNFNHSCPIFYHSSRDFCNSTPISCINWFLTFDKRCLLL